MDTVLGGAAVFSDSGAARLSELVGSSDVVAAAVCNRGMFIKQFKLNFNIP